MVPAIQVRILVAQPLFDAAYGVHPPLFREYALKQSVSFSPLRKKFPIFQIAPLRAPPGAGNILGLRFPGEGRGAGSAGFPGEGARAPARKTFSRNWKKVLDGG